MSRYYITTPIYYVNDKPHIGHCFTTTVADVAARFQRLFGRDVFFLTGTDEHAEKVVAKAREHGVTPLQWADTNAAEFQKAFAMLNISNDDFIRTTQPRHKEKVVAYIRRLKEHGDVYLGDYTGWWDESQEEYLTETTAKEAGFKSPVTGKPLAKRTEHNYFFKLSAYQSKLLAHINENPDFILPESRRNEVLGRLRETLQDIPMSRAVTGSEESQWGILMPDDPAHRIYVWIDALSNYLSAVDTEARRPYWPPAAHTLAKDILWFHAVIWPCMLMALGEGLPRTVYSHSYFVRDGRMSKTLGNFIDMDLLKAYCDRYTRDAVRWFLVTNGPVASADADFSHDKFVEVFNADLANGIGNATSRVSNMIGRYFDGKVPDPKRCVEHAGFGWPEIVSQAVGRCIAKADQLDLAGALREGTGLVSKVDAYINVTEPFKLAKKLPPGESPEKDQLGAILYHCAEALRVATLILSPAMPESMARVWALWNCDAPGPGQSLAHLSHWTTEGAAHSLKPGTPLAKGDALFMRADPAEKAPQ